MTKRYRMAAVVVMLLLASCQQTTKQKRELAAALAYDEVSAWLTDNKIKIPNDISGSDINRLVFGVIEQAEHGYDGSIQFSYTATREFLKDVQKAAGYEFNAEGKLKQ